MPVENSKGEAGVGQHELNVKFSEILDMADRHTVYKQCLKEVADQLGASVTFMAKPYSNTTGSGCHIHLSMNRKSDSKNLFQGEHPVGPVKGSDLFKWCASDRACLDAEFDAIRRFLGGWLKYTPEVMPFYAPTINSCARFSCA